MTANAPYRVLARKYRPRTFEDLIGQEPMVTTLRNAFAAGRIPQAWMLTGVRGVGKTTTARILARALNYAVDGGPDAPTIDMPVPGIHCEAIMEGRHVDVIEMDAASHTGVGDIRDLTDAARYKPVSARYKVYILDEVHMLSTQAFNALLKTLEEPPEHLKFVFATTEIRRVPVTVLSRCQRFDLRRIPADLLIAHLARVANLEGVTFEDAALRMIARAAEGSVRDALSLLDQAIAIGAGEVRAADVKEMLGLADRARIIDLFEHVMRGDAAAALAELGAQYDVGADPAVVIADLANFTHLVTRTKIVPDAAPDAAVTEEELTRGRAFAERLGTAALSRAWQGLLKALSEVQGSARPLAAAEMALVRLCYLSTLPTPEDAVKALAGADGGAAAAAAPSPRAPGRVPAGVPVAEARRTDEPALRPVATRPAAQADARPAPESAARAAPERAGLPARAASAVPAPRLASLADVAALAGEKRAIGLKVAVERQMRPVRFELGRIEVALVEGAPAGIAGELGQRLTEWTGTRWIVSVVSEGGGETLHEADTAAAEDRARDARNDPLVRAVLARFPGAEIVEVRINDPGPAESGAFDADDPAPADDSALDATDTGDPDD